MSKILYDTGESGGSITKHVSLTISLVVFWANIYLKHYFGMLEFFLFLILITSLFWHQRCRNKEVNNLSLVTNLCCSLWQFSQLLHMWCASTFCNRLKRRFLCFFPCFFGYWFQPNIRPLILVIKYLVFIFNLLVWLRSKKNKISQRNFLVCILFLIWQYTFYFYSHHYLYSPHFMVNTFWLLNFNCSMYSFWFCKTIFCDGWCTQSKAQGNHVLFLI